MLGAATQPTKGVSPATLAGGSRMKIESVGGQNRYIAVSTADGAVYCVGEEEDNAQIEAWVEWRPFLYESIADHFYDASYVIERSDANDSVPCNVKFYAQTMLRHSADEISNTGRIDLDTKLSVARASIAQKIAEIANVVAALHSQGRIHGDLKPQNIPRSGQEPKILGRDDTEVIRYLITIDTPFSGHLLAQEREDRRFEVSECRMTSIVGDMLVHQPP
jgi:hypothetical protein